MEEDFGDSEWEDISDEKFTGTESKTDMEDAEIDFDGNKPTGSMEHNKGDFEPAPPPGLNKQYSEDFTCGVCYELLLEPTTLQCGHSFCRICLARWFLSSNKMECPQCRQQYTGLPRVSVTLRSTIEKQMSGKYEERKRMYLSQEAQDNINTFERRVRTYTLQHQVMRGAQVLNPAQGRNRVNWRDKDMWIGLAVITVAVLTVWTILGWLFGSSSESTISKPMARWTEDETMHWLAQVGSWAEKALKENFTNMHVDGSLLTALNEEDLASISSDLDDLHKRAFIVARDAALDLGLKAPGDFWEYKHMHLFKVSWAVVAFQNYPRMAIFYLWLFDYEASFLPLVHSTCPVQDLQYVNLYIQKLDDLTYGQWLDFSFRWLLFPHLGIFGDFTWRHIWLTNVYTSMWILFSLLMLGIIEILEAIYFLMERSVPRRAAVKQWCNKVTQSAFFYFAVYVLWNFIPTFLINLWFYFNFIFSTIGAFTLVRNNINAIKTLNRERNEQRQPNAEQIQRLVEERNRLLRQIQEELPPGPRQEEPHLHRD